MRKSFPGHPADNNRPAHVAGLLSGAHMHPPVYVAQGFDPAGSRFEGLSGLIICILQVNAALMQAHLASTDVRGGSKLTRHLTGDRHERATGPHRVPHPGAVDG
jgi:hypothetical protein